MKKILLFSILSLLQSFLQSSAQNNIGIGTTTPNSSAILDITATDKGVLVPRVNSFAIPSPARGLLVYYNPENAFYYFDGTTWKDISQSSPLSSYVNSPVTFALGTGNAGDSLGSSIGIGDGSYIVVGAPGKTEGSFANAGQVLIGSRIGTSNSYGFTKYPASISLPLAAEDRFGAAVAASKYIGQDIVAGAPFKNLAGVRSGAAYYTYAGNSSAFVPFPTPIAGLAANDLFGSSVSVSGYTYATNKALAVIGAPGDDGGYGRIYIYYRAPNGNFAEEQNLIDLTGLNTDQMGYSVACYINESSGDGWAFTGCPFANASGTERGKVLIYKRNGISNTWQTFQTISGTVNSSNFGKSIDYDVSGTNQLLAIGQPGSASSSPGNVYVYKFDSTANQWVSQTTLNGTSGNRIGEVVSISIKNSSTAYLAASNKAGRISGNIFSNWGIAQIYKMNGDVWTNISELYDNQGAQNYLFGSGISISSEGGIAIGSSGANVNGNNGQGKVLMIKAN